MSRESLLVKAKNCKQNSIFIYIAKSKLLKLRVASSNLQTLCNEIQVAAAWIPTV
jgi:hypothetical protein